LSSTHVSPIELPLCERMDSKGEIFDVFLCHNSEDKPAVREIAQKLSEKNSKPWLDEEQITPGTSWQAALGQQIESIKSAAVFVGESGFGPWQRQEIQALLSQFVERECPVIPVVLPSTKATPELQWTLANLHCVDFRTDLQPLKRLIWGITGQKPTAFSGVLSSEKPATMRETAKPRLIPGRDKHEGSDKAIQKGGSIRPLPSRPIQTTQPNSTFFGAESWSIGWKAFSNTRFIAKCFFL
jgi:hypothetical protein